MKPEIIITIAAVLLLLIVSIPRIIRIGRIAKARYICPHCGYRFRVKWYRLLLCFKLKKTRGQAMLICPVCRTHGLFRREEESA